MPDTKIDALAAYATVHADDLLVVVDVHDTSMDATGTDKKCAVSILDARYQAAGSVNLVYYTYCGGL